MPIRRVEEERNNAIKRFVSQNYRYCVGFPLYVLEIYFPSPRRPPTTHNSYFLSQSSFSVGTPPQIIGWSVWWWCFMYHIVKVRAKMVLLRSFVVVGETRGELWFRSRKGGRWVDRTKGRQSTRRRRRRKTSLHYRYHFYGAFTAHHVRQNMYERIVCTYVRRRQPWMFL